MLKKYRSMNRFAKVFIWLTLLLLIVFVVMYFSYLIPALQLDDDTLRCRDNDLRIMGDFCRYPYSTSVAWAIIGTMAYAWPLLIGWLVTGFIAFFTWNKPSKK